MINVTQTSVRNATCFKPFAGAVPTSGAEHGVHSLVRGQFEIALNRLPTEDFAEANLQFKLETCLQKMSHATSIVDITPVLEELTRTTRALSQLGQTYRSELHIARQRAHVAEAQLVKVQHALDCAQSDACHDVLTGAFNRKGLQAALAREVASMRRNRRPLCVAMIDIDNFKHLNDTLGHAAGDRVLSHLASVLRNSIRPQDTLVRYGGEEFVIVLPDTTHDKGVEALQRLQREVSRRPLLIDRAAKPIQFSAGVAQVAALENGEEALARADQAMYLAKRSGKNRVMCL